MNKNLSRLPDEDRLNASVPIFLRNVLNKKKAQYFSDQLEKNKPIRSEGPVWDKSTNDLKSTESRVLTTIVLN